jgi:hypothetical protein
MRKPCKTVKLVATIRYEAPATGLTAFISERQEAYFLRGRLRTDLISNLHITVRRQPRRRAKR